MGMQKGISIAAMNAKLMGSGKETIILAHGYGGDQSIWDKVLDCLTESYQVVVFDWSFSGSIRDISKPFDALKYSSYSAFADDLIALMDDMNLSSSVFVGHSMSGMIGCIASIKRPKLFKRLLLVGASPRYINLDDYEGGFEKSDVEQLFSSIEFNFDKWTSIFATMVVGTSDPLSVEKYEKCLKSMKPEIALHLAKLVFLSDERDILAKVNTPCTIIQTKSDIAVPNSVPTYMQSKIKAKSTIEIIDMEGHFPQLTAHKYFLEVVERVMSHEICNLK